MKNTTTSNSTNCCMTYQQVLRLGKIKGLFYLLLFFALLMISAAPVSQQSAAYAASSDNYQLEQYSINAAGAIDDSSASYRLGLSLGEPVVGTASSVSYQMGTGFWGEPLLFTCGDANGDGQPNVGDAVFLIAYVFSGGQAPNPLEAGDANCDGDVNLGDAVYLIAYVFNGGYEPCCP